MYLCITTCCISFQHAHLSAWSTAFLLPSVH